MAMMPSPAHERCQMGRIAISLNLDLREDVANLAEVVWRQLDRRAADVFLQPMQFASARDRDDPGLLRE